MSTCNCDHPCDEYPDCHPGLNLMSTNIILDKREARFWWERYWIEFMNMQVGVWLG